MGWYMNFFMRFPWAREESLKKADTIVFGVPDESGSHSKRRGVALAPDTIRKVANKRDVFERNGEKNIPSRFPCPGKRKIFDYGNIKKEEVADAISNVVSKGKLPIIFGGDHSITAEVLKGFDNAKKGVSVVYFDAHPDFICSASKYYGSVICDISSYSSIRFDSSIEIGIREPEPEELLNIRKENLTTITPLNIVKNGLDWVLEQIKTVVKGEIYVSIDVDVLDPAFAPGVSVPVPGGLSTLDLLYLLEGISKIFGERVIGVDVMEVCPPYDINDMTTHLASIIPLAAMPCD